MSDFRRYPGSQSFQDNDLHRLLFSGRDHEKAAFLHLLLAEDLVLIYAKSGMGKTSLLNAGILQQLRDKEYFPIQLRLNELEKDPIESIRNQVMDSARREGVELERDHSGSEHLLPFFQSLRLWKGNVLLIPALIFDQLEELFTLRSSAHRQMFIQQFGQLARKVNRGTVQGGTGSATLQKGPPLKIILSIREDYLGEMEQLAAEVPQVMYSRFRLTALSRQQAEQAIRQPAASADPRFACPPFDYDPQAVKEMLDFLCLRRERRGLVQGDEVEPFQLQVLCEHLEDVVLKRRRRVQRPLGVVSKDLGGHAGMERILQSFYKRQIELFTEAEQEKIRRLCERGLISETEKRLSLEEEEIQRRFGVDEVLLNRMVQLRLLRADPRVSSVYYELSHDTLVAPILKERRERDPDEVFRQAESYRLQGELTKASAAYQRVIRLDQGYARAYLQWATLQKEKGEIDAAEDTLNKLLTLGIKDETLPHVYHLYGQLRAERGDYKTAIDRYWTALNLNRQLPAVYLDLGAACLKRSRLASNLPESSTYLSKVSFEKSRQKDLGSRRPSRPDASRPDNPNREEAAELQREAKDSYKTALELDPRNANTYAELTLLHTELKEFDEAVDLYRKAIGEDPAFAYIYEDLLNALKKENAPEHARRICELALSTESKDADFYFGIGFRLQELNEHALAIKAYEKSSTINPENSPTFNNWGWSLENLGRRKEATEKYKKALDIDRTNNLPLRNLASCLVKMGQTEELNRLFEQMKDYLHNDSMFYCVWGASLGELGRHSEAIEKEQAALKIDANNSDAWTNWGWSLTELGDHAEAISKYRRAIEIDASDAVAYNNLGFSLDALGRVDEAIQSYRKSIEVDPNYRTPYSNLIQQLCRLDRLPEAQPVFYRMEQLQLNDEESLGLLGWWAYLFGDFQKSADYSRRALAMNPDLIDVQFNLALALLHLGQLDEARENYRDAIALANRLDKFVEVERSGITDLRAALKRNPNLPGGQEMLIMLENAIMPEAGPKRRD